MTKEALTLLTEDSRVAGFFEKFSSAIRIYICSYDDAGRMINDFTGSEAERSVLHKYISDDMLQELYARLTIDSIEDQILEDVQGGHLKLGAVALEFEGHCKEVWFFAGVIDDAGNGDFPEDLRSLGKHLGAKDFINAVDALREIGDYRVSAEMSLAMYEEKSRRSLFSAHEMAESLKRVEAFTEILKYLDSDKSTESVMSDFLRITSEYLEVPQADIFKVKERQSGDLMDILATYLADGDESVYDGTSDLPKFDFIEGKKTIILSTGSTLLGNVDERITDSGIKALVSMPVTIGQTTNMYAVYLENRRDRSWQISELQLLSDAVRVLQNILEKRVQKNSILSSYASLEQVLEHVGCAIIVNDVAKKETLFSNKAMQSVFPEGTVSEELQDIIWDRNSDTQSVLEYYDYDRDSWYEIHHSNISWVDGRPVALYAIYDVTDKKIYQRKIEQQAYTDFLTGLLNRLCCERDLARIIDESKKHNSMGALLYIDLDDFKHINDGLGHQYGDVLLKDISAAMKSVKGIEDNCYRMGGDEFVIIIPPRSFPRYDEIVENIKGIFAKPFYLKDGEYYCTMSMGIVTFPDEGENVEELVRKADIAMYSA
ncbi:MAG: GGDEF domain-containing protein, partial [Lachnospiraceae bacterium]|nr:GGDEF domain-containing protein [Lachnospiraceae bacterium]